MHYIKIVSRKKNISIFDWLARRPDLALTENVCRCLARSSYFEGMQNDTHDKLRNEDYNVLLNLDVLTYEVKNVTRAKIKSIMLDNVTSVQVESINSTISFYGDHGPLFELISTKKYVCI